MGARGHRLHRMLSRDVLDDEPLGLAQRLASRLLGCERGAELRLVARTSQEQHQMASDREGRLAVEVLLDERQGEVHSRP